MKHKTLKRTFITLTLALAFLPALNRQIPAPEPVPGTVAAENTTGKEIKPKVQPLDDKDPREKVRE